MEENKLAEIKDSEFQEIKTEEKNNLINDEQLSEIIAPKPVIATSEITNEPTQEQPKQEQQQTSTGGGGMAEMLGDVKTLAQLVTMTGDFIIPPIVSVAFKKFLKKDIPANELKATNDEIKALENAWHKYLLTVNLNLTPAQLLAISLAFVYGGKAAVYSLSPEQAAKVRIKPSKPQEGQQERPQQQNGQRLPSGFVSTRKEGERRGRRPKQI